MYKLRAMLFAFPETPIAGRDANRIVRQTTALRYAPRSW
jgi:hypothetical protein